MEHILSDISLHSEVPAVFFLQPITALHYFGQTAAAESLRFSQELSGCGEMLVPNHVKIKQTNKTFCMTVAMFMDTRALLETFVSYLSGYSVSPADNRWP